MVRFPFGASANAFKAFSLVVPYYPAGQTPHDSEGVLSKSSYTQSKKVKDSIQEFIGSKGTDAEPLIQNILSFAQHWLFFGLLEDIFGRYQSLLNKQDFVREQDGEKTVHFTQLEYYIQRWHVLEEVNGIESSMANLQHTINTLQAAPGYLDELLEQTGFDQHVDQEALEHGDPELDWKTSTFNRPLYPRVTMLCLSIRLLVQKISIAVSSVFMIACEKAGYPKSVVAGPGFKNLGKTRPFLALFLRRLGCCPSDIKIFQLKTDSITLHFLYTIYLHVKRQWPVIKDQDHGSCTDTLCQVQQTYNEDYRQIHMPSCQGCQPVGCRDYTMEMERGTMVGIKYANDEAYMEPLQGQPYIAFSHVWSDGMGNPKANALSACMLRTLQWYANTSCKTKDNVTFWIDTMCVPVNNVTCRRIAIKNMRNIYSQATKVLIFDPSCILTGVQGHDEEMTNALMSTRWSQRLWTLQEAQLASRIELLFNNSSIPLPSVDYHFDHSKPVRLDSANHFYVHGSTVNFPNILLQIQPYPWLQAQKDWLQNETAKGLQLVNGALNEHLDEKRLLRRLIMYQKNKPEIGGLYKEIFDSAPYHAIAYFRDEKNLWRLYWRILDALRWRKTTRVDDETICLATILGLDVGPMFDMSHQDRMVHIVRNVGRIPINIFYFTGKRFLDDGIRWLPSSYLVQDKVNHYRSMAATEVTLNDDPRLARVVKTGLHLKSRAWIFELDQSYSNSWAGISKFQLENEKGGRYWIILSKTPSSELKDSLATQFESLELAILRPIDMRVNSEMEIAILVSTVGGNTPKGSIEARFEGTCAIYMTKSPITVEFGHEDGDPRSYTLNDQHLEQCPSFIEVDADQDWLLT